MKVAIDVAIIGAGPVGLFAVFACGQLGMRAALVDALADPGGQLTALYPEKPIYDIPGRPMIRADALVDDLLAQASAYRPHHLFGQTAVALSEEPDGTFHIHTSAGSEITARAIIIAAGGGAFGPNRPPLEGLADFEGRSVFYHVARRERFRGQQVVIAGGGDSAVDWALSLADIAASVVIVHRRDVFRAQPAAVSRMREDSRIRLLTPYQLEGLIGQDGMLSAVRLARIGGGIETISADALIALFGLVGDLGPLASWAVRVDGKRISVDPRTCESTRPGIFAAGDVAAYPGKLKLILTGFAEAASAAHAAYTRVFPGKALHFEYSTNRGAPSLARAGTTPAS